MCVGSARQGLSFDRFLVVVLLLLLPALAGATEGDLPPEPDRKMIKVVQPKAHLKLGRLELCPQGAWVANDPFLRRYVVGLVGGWYLSEIFSIEADVGFSPTLGEADWTPITRELIEHNHVAPDLSRLTLFGGGSFAFTPIHGKVAVAGRIVHFDLFGVFGMGVVRTVDDLELIGASDDLPALETANQLHPTTRYGGGARVLLGPGVALRIEARSLVYIETISGDVLEMKNNLLVQSGVSFFLPQR